VTPENPTPIEEFVSWLRGQLEELVNGKEPPEPTEHPYPITPDLGGEG
jgi:hypothetical protein